MLKSELVEVCGCGEREKEREREMLSDPWPTNMFTCDDPLPYLLCIHFSVQGYGSSGYALRIQGLKKVSAGNSVTTAIPKGIPTH